MGFAPERVEWALHATNNSGLQSALDHLEENQDVPVPDNNSVQASSTGAPGRGAVTSGDYEEEQTALMEMLKTKGQGAVDAVDGAEQFPDFEAKSIKCADCGRTMKNSALASFHAEKSGHTNFEESTEEVKPLTDEEKKQKLTELRRKLAEKKAAQSQVDAKEARANEQIRRKAGQDMGLAREELKKKEALKDQQRKTAERKADVSVRIGILYSLVTERLLSAHPNDRIHLEQMEARARVKAQIEADKRERVEKAAREKALREGKVDVATSAAPTKPLTAPSSSSEFNASEARLRVRTPAGQWMGTLPVETTLSQVESMIREAGKADGPLKVRTLALGLAGDFSTHALNCPSTLCTLASSVLPDVPAKVFHKRGEEEDSQGARSGPKCGPRS